MADYAGFVPCCIFVMQCQACGLLVSPECLESGALKSRFQLVHDQSSSTYLSDESAAFWFNYPQSRVSSNAQASTSTSAKQEEPGNPKANQPHSPWHVDPVVFWLKGPKANQDLSC